MGNKKGAWLRTCFEVLCPAPFLIQDYDVDLGLIASQNFKLLKTSEIEIFETCGRVFSSRKNPRPYLQQQENKGLIRHAFLRTFQTQNVAAHWMAIRAS